MELLLTRLFKSKIIWFINMVMSIIKQIKNVVFLIKVINIF